MISPRLPAERKTGLFGGLFGRSARGGKRRGGHLCKPPRAGAHSRPGAGALPPPPTPLARPLGPSAMASQVVLATAGYDHTIRFWEATSGVCYRTLQYADSQVCGRGGGGAGGRARGARRTPRRPRIRPRRRSPTPVPPLPSGQQAGDHGRQAAPGGGGQPPRASGEGGGTAAPRRRPRPRPPHTTPSPPPPPSRSASTTSTRPTRSPCSPSTATRAT